MEVCIIKFLKTCIENLNGLKNAKPLYEEVLLYLRFF